MKIVKSIFFFLLISTLMVMFAWKYGWHILPFLWSEYYAIGTACSQPILITLSIIIYRKEKGSIKWLAALSILLSAVFLLAIGIGFAAASSISSYDLH